MTRNAEPFRMCFLVIALTTVLGCGLYGCSTSSTPEMRGAGEERSIAHGKSDAPVARPSEETTTGPTLAPTGGILPHRLIGTWSKVRARQEDHDYPGDANWRLSVTFNDDGHFIWNSKRFEDSRDPRDESLRGTYLIERGFIITYRFNEPSPAAEPRLSEWFAFLPNQRVGQQTFKFRDDVLVLGHDAAKLWIDLKK